MPAVSIQWPSVADVGMAAVIEGKQNATLSLSSAKKVLHNLFTFNMNEEEAAQALLPRVLPHRDESGILAFMCS